MDLFFVSLALSCPAGLTTGVGALLHELELGGGRRSIFAFARQIKRIKKFKTGRREMTYDLL